MCNISMDKGYVHERESQLNSPKHLTLHQHPNQPDPTNYLPKR